MNNIQQMHWRGREAWRLIANEDVDDVPEGVPQCAGAGYCMDEYVPYAAIMPYIPSHIAEANAAKDRCSRVSEQIRLLTFRSVSSWLAKESANVLKGKILGASDAWMKRVRIEMQNVSALEPYVDLHPDKFSAYEIPRKIKNKLLELTSHGASVYVPKDWVLSKPECGPGFAAHLKTISERIVVTGNINYSQPPMRPFEPYTFLEIFVPGEKPIRVDHLPSNRAVIVWGERISESLPFFKALKKAWHASYRLSHNCFNLASL